MSRESLCINKKYNMGQKVDIQLPSLSHFTFGIKNSGQLSYYSVVSIQLSYCTIA